MNATNYLSGLNALAVLNSLKVSRQHNTLNMVVDLHNYQIINKRGTSV